MKNIILSLVLILCLGTNTTKAQGCDPAINGFSFDIASCLNNNTSILVVDWAMSGAPTCSAPSGSFVIQINLPAGGVYGVNSATDVITPSSFDWVLLSDGYTLEGTNNVDIDWLDGGAIEVEINPFVANACDLIESNSNIAILPSSPPFFGSPGDFDNDDTNDTQNDQLGVSVVVPVRLLSFEAVNLDCDQNQLDWSTGSEINNAGFEVQRSVDGINFEEIGFIEALEDSKNGIREYRFKDERLEGGQQYYYRIKQIDLDGQYEIFDIQAVEVTCDDDIIVSLFPNPAKHQLNFQITGYSGSDLELMIHSVDGKLVKHISRSSQNEIIDITDLDAGMYLLKTITTTEIVEENFIKID